jgi:hypothetical protein
VSHALTANNIREYENCRIFASVRFTAAAIDVAQLSLQAIDFGPMDEADSPEAEIVSSFRRKLAGLRLLSRSERAQAVRAALEWLWFAMAALREKRTYRNHGRLMLRRLQGPAPG